MRIAHVYMEHPTMKLDKTFTYDCANFSLQRGMRVKVPFGNKQLIGFVDSVEDIDDTTIHQWNYRIKSIIDVLDEEPLINEELFKLAHEMARTCAAPLISCFQCMLPSKLKPKSSKQTLKKEAWIVFHHRIDQITKRQKEILDIMELRKEMLRSTFYKEFKSAGKKLLENGCLAIEERLSQAKLEETNPEESQYTLTPEQRQAVAQIFHHRHHKTFLLHGVTGSGKTEVFLQLAKRVIEQNKQVLFLVPEISLTPQMMTRVKQRFGANVAIYHSNLNAQEKYEQYMLVKHKRVSIVVGTRSAVFMPFDHLGLLIMDEEHDLSYKQDNTPRYHCRDIAHMRSIHHDCPLILASATPSLESYARAYKGLYQLVEMPHRINDTFPKVTIVEMRKAVSNGEDYILSNALLEKIHDRLQKKEQIILLLNRRGYTPILRCISCGYVQMCPHCDTSMNYHKDEHQLICHTCGHHMLLPQSCPECGKSAWRYLGMGTQRLEEMVSRKFPKARILRMDADTTSKKFAHEELLGQFQRHESDILLGTQMIAKGLDFEQVTLVGILNGDALLNRNDYRSAELTYDLLEQASGRSGRHAKHGEVVIQAYDPNHYAIRCAAEHDYATFFAHEMRYRHIAGYPPYQYLVALRFIHKEEIQAMDSATHYLTQFQKDKNMKILGPAPLGKIKDEYHVRLLLKGKSQSYLNEVVWTILKQHDTSYQKVRIEADLQPLVLE